MANVQTSVIVSRTHVVSKSVRGPVDAPEPSVNFPSVNSVGVVRVVAGPEAPNLLESETSPVRRSTP